MTGGIGLAIQTLRANQRVLVLGHVAGIRNGTGWFSTDDLIHLFEALHLPEPGSPVRSLRQLQNRGEVRTRGDGSWALTPIGGREVAKVVGEIDYGDLAIELAGTPGAEFASARQSTIAPVFAPARWQAGISRLLDRFPFESSVFLMTRFPEEGRALPDPVPSVVERIRQVGAMHGLVLHVASDRQAEDDLLGNVGSYMWGSQFGIGLLEDRLGDGSTLNDNVLIELGCMLAIGRRCAILKDPTAPQPPTDLSGQIYKPIDFDEVDAVGAAVHMWIAEDLALGRCSGCPRQSLEGTRLSRWMAATTCRWALTPSRPSGRDYDAH